MGDGSGVNGFPPAVSAHKLQATSYPPPFPLPRARPACRPRPGAHAANDAEGKDVRDSSTTNHKLRATNRCLRAAFQKGLA